LVCSTNLPFSSQMPFPNPNSWFHLVWGEDKGATNSIIPREALFPSHWIISWISWNRSLNGVVCFCKKNLDSTQIHLSHLETRRKTRSSKLCQFKLSMSRLAPVLEQSLDLS
jgi:hypothetical protein